MSTIGVVIIGRNEGERLRRCVASVRQASARVVYVDSASTDGSAGWAQAQGIAVVELDLSIPFTAARARNAGVERLVAIDPDVRFIQFVDGDCEVIEGWLGCARQTLEANPALGVVAGRLRERFPERSIYNRLADVEWDRPAGPTRSCGGIAMMRASALSVAGGFDPTLIAGEEGELCLRLRRLGWGIVRLDAPMAYHDMEMSRFGQWWKRAVRAGYACAESASRYGGAPERYLRREWLSNWFWGFALPVVGVALALVTRGAGLLLLAAYALLGLRIYLRQRGRGLIRKNAFDYAVFCIIGKFAQLLGQFRFWKGRLNGRRSGLIEYKTTPQPIQRVSTF